MANPFDKFDENNVNPFDKFDEQKPKSDPSINDRGGFLQNFAGGLMRGAGSIGATLLTPIDAAARAVGVQNDFIGRDDRRAAMDDALRTVGVNTDSYSFKGGKLASEVAGTSGVGGILAKPIQALAATRYASGMEPILNGIASALQTGGFRAGELAGTGAGNAARVVGGAVTGGASAGMVNPEDAGMGALVGSAIHGVVKLTGEAGKAAGRAISGVTKNTIGMTTGAGAETFGTAYRAGKEGGTSFLDNMRGNVPMTDVLDGAKDALSKMRVERGNQYRSGMFDISKDKSVINFSPIENAVNSLQQMGSFKGQVINKNASGTVDEVAGLVNKWKSLDPAEFHTPEGLDALKKAISDVRDATQFGTPGRKAADTVYNAVKAQIELQAPTYAKVMKDYSQASATLTEIEKALSLGNKAGADTSMRKLQSLMRNNVNTNYGNRLELAKTLQQNGADILPAIAGQAASSFTPRGLQGLAATGAGVAGMMNPASLAALPFTSPRLMGELSYGLGALSRGAGNVAGKVGGASSQFLGRMPQGLLDMEQFVPLLPTAAAVTFSQR